jgi:4-carboxymuconolactone decarboxylase
MAKKKMTENLQKESTIDHRVLNQLVKMTDGSFEESGLDPETFMLVRIAALAAMDASPASWLLNFKISSELELTPDAALGTLAAVAPIVGTARTVSAAGNILKAIGLSEQFDKEARRTKFAH